MAARRLHDNRLTRVRQICFRENRQIEPQGSLAEEAVLTAAPARERRLCCSSAPLGGGSRSGQFDAPFSFAPESGRRVRYLFFIPFPEVVRMIVGNTQSARTKSNSHKATMRFVTTDGATVTELDAARVIGALYGNGKLDLVDGEVPLLTVVHDDDWEVGSCWFMRLIVREGKFTLESLRDATLANIQHWAGGSQPDVPPPDAGWPPDWRQQIGEIMGVSEFSFNEMGTGGPLAVALWNGLEVDDVAQLFYRTHLQRARADD